MKNLAYTFRGGVHMNEYKITASSPIEVLPAPDKVVIPLSQHIGVPCKALVSVGDKVDKGQVIGAVEKGLGCPVHASVSGTVEKIESVYTPQGRKVEQIVIDSDGENRISPDIKPYQGDIYKVSPEDCIEAVRVAGISGMGGATFPTYAKIASAIGKVKHIIINSAECEPFITANHRLMLESPDEIIAGLRILMHVFGLEKGLIAVEDNKPDAIVKLREAVGDGKDIEVKEMKTKYPQGDERQIIYALTGVELKAGKLPADVGCVIFNSETCYNVYRALALGMPLIERIVTVTGDCVRNPKNILAPIGTPVSELIEFCGGLKEKPAKLISGGPMMGVAQWDINIPVTKGTNAVLALSEKFTAEPELPFNCIHCGKCIRVCPMHLMPLFLARNSKKGDYDECEKLNVLSCVECGSCAYICPGKVPIVQFIRVAKSVVNEKRRAKLLARQSDAQKPAAPGKTDTADRPAAEKTDNLKTASVKEQDAGKAATSAKEDNPNAAETAKTASGQSAECLKTATAQTATSQKSETVNTDKKENAK